MQKRRKNLVYFVFFAAFVLYADRSDDGAKSRRR